MKIVLSVRVESTTNWRILQLMVIQFVGPMSELLATLEVLVRRFPDTRTNAITQMAMEEARFSLRLN